MVVVRPYLNPCQSLSKPLFDSGIDNCFCLNISRSRTCIPYIIQRKVGRMQYSQAGAVITLPQQTINLSIFGVWHLGLSNERTSENKNAILDEFYGRLEAEFVKSPEDYKMELVVAVVNVKKA